MTMDMDGAFYDCCVLMTHGLWEFPSEYRYKQLLCMIYYDYLF